MVIKFNIRKQGKNDPVIVMHVYDSRFKGRKFMYSTGNTVPTALWDKRKQRVKTTSQNPILNNEINLFLDKLVQVTNVYRNQKLTALALSRQELKEYIKTNAYERSAEVNEIEKHGKFHETWQHIINTTRNNKGKYLTSGTLRSKNQTLELIKKFEKSARKELTFENLDMQFYHDFDKYMIKQDLSDNTRGRHFKEIKAILKEALDRDIPINLAFQKKRFKVIRIPTESIFLTDEEIKRIFKLRLTPAKEKIRDIFVMACYVGARHGDWHQIKKSNIVVENGKEILKYKQEKTNEIVHIPIHTCVKMILNKYNDLLPKVISNQKFNSTIKTICKDAELGEVQMNNKSIPKWKLVSTHTARRSFATNAYLSKTMDVYQIMRCTGHRSESSFLRYLKLNGRDYAMQAADSKFFTDESWSNLKIA